MDWIGRGAWLAGVLGVFLLAGCGSPGAMWAHATQVVLRSGGLAPPAAHTIHHDGVTLVVPVSWHLGKQVRITMVPAVGAKAGLLLPLVPRPNVGRRALYRTATFHRDGRVVRGEVQALSATGTFYTVLLVAPRSEAAAVQHALQSIHLPPIATATTAVPLMFHQATTSSPLWLSTSPPYVLASAGPLAGSELFFLYSTPDGGVHWTLVNWTGRSRQVFPDRGGLPTMIFSTASRGVVAEVTMRSHKLLVYQTRNGGETWSVDVLSPPPSVDPRTGAEVSHPRRHTWTVMVQLTSGARETFTTVNSGGTWTTSVARP